MDEITCHSIYGNPVTIPREKLQFRLGVYAVMLREDKALLVTNRSSGKFSFPGGGVDRGETLQEALRRELREEAGIEIDIRRFLRFREDFFYYDPKDEAFQSIQFFYLCEPCSEVPPEFMAEDDESEAPCWIKICELREENFQSEIEFELLKAI